MEPEIRPLPASETYHPVYTYSGFDIIVVTLKLAETYHPVYTYLGFDIIVVTLKFLKTILLCWINL